MALSQRLSTQSTSSSDSLPPSENILETASTPSSSMITDNGASSPSEKRKPLHFEPEPSQRMVVVRRRKRRRSKKTDKAEQTASNIRFFLFGLVVILLLVSISGQQFAQALLEQFKDTLRPIKGMIQVPKLEVIALIIAGVVLLSMMPGVESTVKRWLGISSRPKR